MITLQQGDCLELMEKIPAGSVDLILCDLPYGITDCKWDRVIPFEALWTQYRRVLKPLGVCVLFGNQPFTTNLIHSNPKEFSHIWYWKKNYVTGFLKAKKQPLRNIEEVVVFVCNSPSRNNTGRHMALRQYLLIELERSGKTRREIDAALCSRMSSHYFTWGSQFALPSEDAWTKLQQITSCFNRPYTDIRAEYEKEIGQHTGKGHTYNPQGVKDVEIRHRNGKPSVYSGCRVGENYIQAKSGYPKTLLEFDGLNSRDRVHPTQKPVPLLEYLIKTYSNPGDTVLDNCMGSGSTGVACVNTGRRFIGIELDPEYFAIAQRRVEGE